MDVQKIRKDFPILGREINGLPLVYFDNAATTPIRKEVIDLMSNSMLSVYGNPSSIHGFGRSAKSSIENARKSMSKLLNCEPQEIIFHNSKSTLMSS